VKNKVNSKTVGEESRENDGLTVREESSMQITEVCLISDGFIVFDVENSPLTCFDPLDRHFVNIQDLLHSPYCIHFSLSLDLMRQTTPSEYRRDDNLESSQISGFITVQK
jgi:hypothetical protein